MGLSSFFCCGADASSDTDDKHTSQTALRSAAPNGANKGPRGTGKDNRQTQRLPLNGTKDTATVEHVTQDKAHAAAAADDNSANESVTLSVPNEDTSKLDTAKGENGKENENGNGNPNATQPQAGSVEHPEIVASVSDDATAHIPSDTQAENAVGTDARSTFDLSAIQENQAFNPETGFLLGKKDTKRFGNKKCLVLDLDETLVHSSFKYLRTADFVIPVEIEDQVHHVYVIKRPGVDEFLRKVGQWYEVVVFTASVAKYGDPLLNKLDIHRAVHQRLFRDSCYSYQGNFIKNLSQLGRPLQDSIIIDNSPASYIFHPQHSVPISSWFSDTHDNELLDLLPLLEDLSKPNVDDVSLVLDLTM